VDGLGTFLEIDREKSHCSVLGAWWNRKGCVGVW
jgi:hypothetical protein